MRGAHPAVAVAHEAAQRPRPAASPALPPCAYLDRAVGDAQSPARLRGGPGRAGGGLAVPHGCTGVDRDAGHPRLGRLWVLVRAHPRVAHIWKSTRFVEIVCPVVVITVS